MAQLFLPDNCAGVGRIAKRPGQWSVENLVTLATLVLAAHAAGIEAPGIATARGRRHSSMQA